MSETYVKVQYAPGPWNVVHDRTGVVDSDGRYLLSTWESCNFPVEVCKANAHLIAAAPEILEVLLDARNSLAAAMRLLVDRNLVDEFLDRVRALGIKDGVGIRADAAIRKARGEQ